MIAVRPWDGESYCWRNVISLTLTGVAFILVAGFGGRAFGDEPGDHGVTVEVAAERVGNQTPDLTPREVVNSITYRHYDPEPAKQAWFTVTDAERWTDAEQDAWWPFAKNIMMGESAYCPNRQRGDVVVPYSTCIIERAGRHEDVGIAQITRVHYGPGQWLCVEHGICTAAQIRDEPWWSFRAFVLLLEREGSQPWCFNDRIRRYHNCGLAPDR